jgi:hypothetical protein
MSMMLPSAINLPAQTFYQTLPVLVPMLSQCVASIATAVWGRWHADGQIQARRVSLFQLPG